MAKVLLVEDEQFIRELYARVLTDAGHSVEVAADGEEALVKILIGGYDLILLDIMMPKKDGISVLKDIQGKTPKFANGKIVMLTVLNTEEFIKSAFSLGADGYLMKSALTPEQIVAEVRSFLSASV